MAKRSAQSEAQLFDIELESLLNSDESLDERNDSQASSTESEKQQKKFKTKDSKTLHTTDATAKIDVPERMEQDDENGEFSDVSKFFENVGNDLGKSIQLRKNRLNEFTETIISAFESKLVEFVKRQECEMKELKEHTLSNIQVEFSKAEDEFKKLTLYQNKIIKVFEQHAKLIQKMATNLEALNENLGEIHKNFAQGIADLTAKHQSECLDLKKSLGTDISTLQNKFLKESKEEEMRNVKKYLSTIYF